MRRTFPILLTFLLLLVTACRLFPGGSSLPMVTPTPPVSPTPPPSSTPAPPEPPTGVASATAAATAVPDPTATPVVLTPTALPSPLPTLPPDVPYLEATAPLALRALPDEGADVVLTVPAGSRLQLIGQSSNEAWLAVPALEAEEGVLWVRPVGIDIVGRLDALSIIPDPASAEYVPRLGMARSRILFEPGAVSATYSGVVRWPVHHSFVFRAMAEQPASILIEAEGGPAGFQMWGAEDGQPYKRFVAETPVWESILPRTQDYYLDVGMPTGSATYTITLTILPAGQRLDPPAVLVEGGTGLVVGAHRNGRWYGPEVAAALLPFESDFARWQEGTSKGVLTMIQAYGAGGACPVPRMAPAEPGTPFDGLLLANVQEPLPRPVEPLPPEDAAWRAVVDEFLTDQGLPGAEISITQAWRVDLEGDGGDETVLAANFFANEQSLPVVAAGDYAVLLLIRQVNGQQQVLPVVADLYLEDASLVYPYAYGLTGILDLDGDGVLEVIVSAERYEGHRIAVYGLNPETGSVRRVLEAGCDL